MNNPHSSKTVSLSVHVTIVAALVTAVAMAVYAVIQYFTMPERTVAGLVFEHSWHVLALGTLIYVVFYAVMHRQVVQPIRALFIKCYAITKGDLDPIRMDSRISEVQAIAEGLNMMLERIRRTETRIPLNEIGDCAALLRQVANDGENSLTPTSQNSLLTIAGKLEQAASR
jgi:nitrogen fixation/metabolism regulation signal transduction histidine kinase